MRFLLATLLCFLVFESHSQTRTFVNFENKGNTAVLTVSDGQYQIKFISDQVVETAFEPNGEQGQPTSHIVEDKAGVAFSQKNESENEIFIQSYSLKVKIQKRPFELSYFRGSDLLFSELKGYSKPDSTHQISLKISPAEVLYGGGARVLGMNRRGNKLPLFNRAHYGYETRAEQMNFCLPIFISSKIYMVHFDNPTTGSLDLDSQRKNEVNFNFHSGRKAYQVIIGNDWRSLVFNYTSLTGRQPLLPIWALGNFASRFGYHSQEEVMRTAKAYEDAQIPVDALILDLYWFGKEIKGTMGNLAWYKEKFPDGKKMISDLRQKGIKTILITEPFILTSSGNWQNAVESDVLVKEKSGKPATWDFYFGNTGLVDVFDEKGKKWFWGFYKKLISDGAAGQWGDLGEPEVLPENAFSSKGKADEFRNIYGHQWAKMVYEGYEKDFPAQRPFILMRSGYSGSQKYGMVPWSGDVNRTWGGMQGQVELSLQMGMQGLAYMHSDLGGFAGDNLDDELYTRWLQYGVFQPIFRPHAQEEVPSEPVFRSEGVRKLAKQAIDLRYRLLPYNYDLARENAITGMPLMRPLFFEEKDNQKLFEFDKGYLWGSQFLIYPIKEKGQAKMEVYFPKSSDWLDFYSGQKFKGGTTQVVDVREDAIPTFVKAGSFIPMTKWVKSTDSYNPNVLEIHFFNDEEVKYASGSFSFDDGVSTKAWEENHVASVSSAVEKTSKSMVFTFGKKAGQSSRVNADMSLDLKINQVNKSPKRIRVDGKKVKASYDKEKKQLTIHFILKNGGVKIEVR